MEKFYQFIERLGFTLYENNKYCKIGKSYYLNNEIMEGTYWFYETENYIMNIHDFFIKKEHVMHTFPDLSPFMSFCSTYIITGSGESFYPYQTLSSNSMYINIVKDIADSRFRCLMHANFPYITVGINFKENIIDSFLADLKKDKNFKISSMFFDTKEMITAPIGKLATTILNCDMDSFVAKFFLDAKAKEWLSITLDAYLKKEKLQSISDSDEYSIKNVTNYINDHYALNISLEILEKISMMSKTKLKNLFKQKYNMSITEYIQRKRMNIAETLLITGNLDIKAIAKSVGYTSHSKFTSYFKRYKGIYPRDVKRLGEKLENK